jgi:hypothetical protein
MANTYAANFGDVVKHTVLCADRERVWVPHRQLVR